ncbi:hypothetical protein K488DRAFT_48253 [Vararia minispora EC-137]|uniref:Uncharacterized protein n=1 Tax=Vararia minispora EC-137 TaxID=1314806 RepID=A0ACB8QNC6_9AGAM|nr:hypothetical protein K488DRAFT_48253 [Vararia minispora EC-137]
MHVQRFTSLPGDHPLNVVLRTYTLALSLSLGPTLVSLLTSRHARSRGLLVTLHRILCRELSISGFPFAITLAVGGGAVLQRAWTILAASANVDGVDLRRVFGERAGARLDDLRMRLSMLAPPHKAFICHALTSLVSIILMQSRKRSSTPTPQAPIPYTPPISNGNGRRISPTLDLTLLFVVRAMDSLVQRLLFGRQEDESGEARDRRRRVTTKIDALVFWASSARIMWCFFYEPNRLPRSYVKWILSLANIDRRLVAALQAIREGRWSYIRGTPGGPNMLADLAQDLGYPRSWAEPGLVPAFGGPTAASRWAQLGVTGRDTVGGIPCEIVHGAVTGSSCSKNVALRGLYAFLEAIALYTPATPPQVHFLPSLLINPRSLLSPPKTAALLFGVLRSASFLSTFVWSIWASVCLTRTVLLARLLPFISHDFWDGPFGCIMAGCLACGSGIWIENGRRRGEMALYVLPRAIRSWLPNRWLRSGRRGVIAVERLAYALSLAYLMTTATHYPASLRGLARWTLAVVTKGGLKRDRQLRTSQNGCTGSSPYSGHDSISDSQNGQATAKSPPTTL